VRGIPLLVRAAHRDDVGNLPDALDRVEHVHRRELRVAWKGVFLAFQAEQQLTVLDHHDGTVVTRMYSHYKHLEYRIRVCRRGDSNSSATAKSRANLLLRT